MLIITRKSTCPTRLLILSSSHYAEKNLNFVTSWHDAEKLWMTSLTSEDNMRRLPLVLVVCVVMFQGMATVPARAGGGTETKVEGIVSSPSGISGIPPLTKLVAKWEVGERCSIRASLLGVVTTAQGTTATGTVTTFPSTHLVCNITSPGAGFVAGDSVCVDVKILGSTPPTGAACTAGTANTW